VKETPIIQRNVDNLRFLRELCSVNGRGISINQEILFKIVTLYPDLKKGLFIPATIKGNDIILEIGNENMIPLQ